MKETIKEIAVKAGVSQADSSKILNGNSDIAEKKRQRIIPFRQELGDTSNIVACTLVKKINNTVIVLIPDISTQMNSIFLKENNDTVIPFGCEQLRTDPKRRVEQKRN